MVMTEIENEAYLKDMQLLALKRAGTILGREISVQSFNGIIGGKNGVYNVDALDYQNADEYVKAWHIQHENIYEREKDCGYEKSSHRVHALLEDDLLREYIDSWLRRTFYRKNRN